jgi:hypothetical protein
MMHRYLMRDNRDLWDVIDPQGDGCQRDIDFVIQRTMQLPGIAIVIIMVMAVRGRNMIGYIPNPWPGGLRAFSVLNHGEKYIKLIYLSMPAALPIPSAPGGRIGSSRAENSAPASRIG